MGGSGLESCLNRLGCVAPGEQMRGQLPRSLCWIHLPHCPQMPYFLDQHSPPICMGIGVLYKPHSPSALWPCPNSSPAKQAAPVRACGTDSLEWNLRTNPKMIRDRAVWLWERDTHSPPCPLQAGGIPALEP